MDKVPFTIYENKLPQCSVERRLRNAGMCIVNRMHNPYVTERPNCVMQTLHCREGGRPRVREIIRTPAGELSNLMEPAEFTNWHVEKLFKGPEDYKALLAMVEDTRYRPDYEAYAEAEASLGDDVILRGGVGLTPLQEIMIVWMGLETFAVEWMERREEILRIARAMAQKRRELYSILADSPITHANYGGNEVPEVMGAPRYKEFCIPLFNECAEILHEKGKLLGTHLDGNNRAWASAVAESRLDYIEAFTPDPDTDMTLADALEAWPNKVLWINFPSSVHLASIEQIKLTTRGLLDQAAGSNRLIIGITEDIPANRWQENLLAIMEVINSG